MSRIGGCLGLDAFVFGQFSLGSNLTYQPNVKIRDVLGPTDPSKAPPGSVRREFGSNIMVNAAHASDSVESAQREMAIVNVGENNFRAVVEEVYGKG